MTPSAPLIDATDEVAIKMVVDLNSRMVAKAASIRSQVAQVRASGATDALVPLKDLETIAKFLTDTAELQALMLEAVETVLASKRGNHHRG